MGMKRRARTVSPWPFSLQLAASYPPLQKGGCCGGVCPPFNSGAMHPRKALLLSGGWANAEVAITIVSATTSAIVRSTKVLRPIISFTSSSR
jgi:hypothetical protein